MILRTTVAEGRDEASNEGLQLRPNGHDLMENSIVIWYFDHHNVITTSYQRLFEHLVHLILNTLLKYCKSIKLCEDKFVMS
jgi:hypothetical protein